MNNSSSTIASRFRSIIASATKLDPQSPALLIDREGEYACHYAPFEHVNRNARIVLVGITPGKQQAGNALDALQSGLRAGMSDEDALAMAKRTASFSGPMRQTLVDMLDHLGLDTILGLNSCEELFASRTDLVHFTSALRYPVFKDGKDYSGSRAVLTHPFLRGMWATWLAEEAAELQDAWWIPLGVCASEVLKTMAATKLLDETQVLSGIPHPSPSSRERSAYFLGRKERERLSNRTNPDKIDHAKQRLLEKLAPVV